MDIAPSTDQSIEDFLEGLERRLLAQLESPFCDTHDAKLIEQKLVIVRSVR
jgi:hypothetical protein